MRANRSVKHPLLLFFGVLLAASGALAQAPSGSGTGVRGGELDIPRIDALPRRDRDTRLTREQMQSSAFILKTEPRAAAGDAYVIVTDHRDEGFLKPLQRLAKHRAGTMVQVEDLAALHTQPAAREQLRTQLRQARPRFVAIAPRLENYRENMLLSMWEVLSTPGGDPQLEVFPALLVAPNQFAFAALIEHSISYRPQRAEALRPFVVGQVVDNSSILGVRSLQKVGIVRNVLQQDGVKPASLIVRTFQARRSEGGAANGPQQWEVTAAAPRRFIAALPPEAKQALDAASLLVMFGHGVPGMTCSLEVGAFREVTMANKIVLCGSCFSAYPIQSDFPPLAGGPDGSPIRNDRERFLMRALENGAVVAYGHMRENGGFPQLYPVLEAWLNGLSVGEAYQRLMNALIRLSGLRADELILQAKDAGNQRAVMQRNQLLYVIIGDPALQPLASLTAGK